LSTLCCICIRPGAGCFTRVPDLQPIIVDRLWYRFSVLVCTRLRQQHTPRQARTRRRFWRGVRRAAIGITCNAASAVSLSRPKTTNKKKGSGGVPGVRLSFLTSPSAKYGLVDPVGPGRLSSTARFSLRSSERRRRVCGRVASAMGGGTQHSATAAPLRTVFPLSKLIRRVHTHSSPRGTESLQNRHL
jgi:hypothetical protein